MQTRGLVVGDVNCVVVVMRDFADEILERLYAQRESLEKYMADVKVGKFSNAWADKQLEEAGCIFNE